MTITNDGNLTVLQFCDEMIEAGRDEEAWAIRHGFETAQEYQAAAQESVVEVDRAFDWGEADCQGTFDLEDGE